METGYLPIPWEYREIIDEHMSKETTGKVFFFGEGQQLCEAQGKVLEFEEIAGAGLFIRMEDGQQVRTDRIITLFGIPGAAFDEYDSYANACFDCMGGFDHLE